MFEKVNCIKLSGREYPYKCDLLVLEKIQDTYGDLSDFENRLTGFEPSINDDGSIKRNEDGHMLGIYKTPDLKVLGKTLCWMIQEGIEIDADEKKKEAELIDEKMILRAVDIPPGELGKILQKEFARCFERKNEKTT